MKEASFLGKPSSVCEMTWFEKRQIEFGDTVLACYVVQNLHYVH
jgi:hypothetical protein